MRPKKLHHPDSQSYQTADRGSDLWVVVQEIPKHKRHYSSAGSADSGRITYYFLEASKDTDLETVLLKYITVARANVYVETAATAPFAGYGEST